MVVLVRFLSLDMRRRLNHLLDAETFAVAGQHVAVSAGIERIDVRRKTRRSSHR